MHVSDYQRSVLEVISLTVRMVDKMTAFQSKNDTSGFLSEKAFRITQLAHIKSYRVIGINAFKDLVCCIHTFYGGS